MPKSGLFSRSILLLLALCVALPAFAEGRIRGVVKTDDGRLLADVRLELRPTDPSTPTQNAKTNKKGKFVFGLVRPGKFRLIALQDGMRVSRLDANIAVPDDRDFWSYDEELDQGMELPVFTMSGISDMEYNVLMTPHTGDIGKFGTGMPVSPTARIARMIEEGRTEEAMTDLDKAIERSPGSATLHYLKGFASRATGDLDTALAAADRALELDSTLEGAQLLRGKILEAMERNDDAAVAFRAEADSAMSMQVRRDALLGLANALIHGEKLPEAAAVLEQLIEIDPSIVDAYKELADLYTRLGETEKAKAMVDMVLEMGGEDPNLLYNIGAERFNESDFEAAQEYFTKALAARPDFADAHLRLAFTRLNLGNREGAAESLRAYLEHSPEDAPDVASARAILQQLEQ